MRWQKILFIRRAGAMWLRCLPFSSVCLVCQVSSTNLVLKFTIWSVLSLSRKSPDDRRFAKMWTSKEARNHRLSAVPHLLRSSILRDYDANAGSPLLPPRLDIRRFLVSGLSVCLLQQRLRVDVVDDSDDNQSLHSHHVSTLVSKDLSNKVHHPSAVSRLVHLVPYHGELWMKNILKFTFKNWTIF